MLTIKVWCLPVLGQETLESMTREIIGSVNGIEEMIRAKRSKEGDILVLYPTDMMRYGLGSEVLVEVTGFTDKFEFGGPFGVRTSLARLLGTKVQSFVPQATVFVRVHKPEPQDGVWCGAKQIAPSPSSAPAAAEKPEKTRQKKQEYDERLLKMSARDFFSKERFEAAGVRTKCFLIKIQTLIASSSSEKTDVPPYRTLYPKITTVEEFLRLTERDILRVLNIGVTTLRAIKDVLAHEGLELSPYVDCDGM